MNRLDQYQQAPMGGPTCQAVVLDVNWPQSEGTTSVYVFLLDARGRFPSKDHLLFAKRARSPDGATRLIGPRAGDSMRVQVQTALPAVDPGVHRIRFVVAVSQANSLLSSADHVDLVVWDPTTGDTMATFSATPGGTSKCLVLADLYREAGSWMLETKGDGFTGSIVDLANQVGVAS
jgi:stress response protein SCP2